MSEQNKPQDTGDSLSFYYWLALLAFLLVTAAFAFMFRNTEFSGNSAEWGQFGDYFGGMLNPLLAFVGLLALLKTIRLQSQELKLSRAALDQAAEELALSREELSGSRQALEEQSKGIDKQVFEATFFHLFRIYQEIRNKEVNIAYTATQSVGQYTVIRLTTENKSGSGIGELRKYFSRFTEYTQSISTLFQYLSNNDTGREKHFYLTLIKQQFSQDEQRLLFYIGLHEAHKGLPFLKDAIETYQLLAKVRMGFTAECALNKNSYHKSAFGETG